ncbi:hypothetical protein [Iodobacter fluviatilis]|uniref:Uncharacterized protein n=1 Tax=Iodobacter fluviatilis TaxID=537 RepID=A0A377Q8Z0_9NEIS|nr:hypothetical protein [Iodobacter fluviatilis]TCU88729.1 hypothetical protein EV682_103313 [Iodobacter fluviatilis]STQ91200.1 Uncharacterised protein [Iodobacter fluviatilis]
MNEPLPPRRKGDRRSRNWLVNIVSSIVAAVVAVAGAVAKFAPDENENKAQHATQRQINKQGDVIEKIDDRLTVVERKIEKRAR